MTTKHKQNRLCRALSLLMIAGILLGMTTMTATAYNTDTANNSSAVAIADKTGNMVYRTDDSAITKVDKENDSDNTEEEESGSSPIIFIIIAVVIVGVVVFVVKGKKNNNTTPTIPSQPQYTTPPRQNTNNQPKSNIVPNPNAVKKPTVSAPSGTDTAKNVPTSATLLYLRKDERITIDKPEFIIGREKKKVDYCIINNVSVSRTHLKITMRNGKYYITDLNSSNFTYLNNTRLHPYQEKEIHKGDKINIAEEEFEFLG